MTETHGPLGDPPPEALEAGADESGLIAYATLLAIYRIAVDPSQLRHSLGHHRAIDADDLKRLATLVRNEESKVGKRLVISKPLVRGRRTLAAA